jgi:nitroreductase
MPNALIEREIDLGHWESEQVETAFRWRYAVKMFDSTRKISPRDWEALENSLLLSPSGYGLQPWKFFLIQDPDLRQRLTPVSCHQTQLQDCSHLVVFASRTSVDENYIGEFTSAIATARGVPRSSLKGFFDMVVADLVHGPKSRYATEWAARQTYIALGALVTAAALMKVDSCPLEGIEPERYDEILDLRSSGYRTRVACALGYRSPEDKYAIAPKVRFGKERIIHYL